MDIQEEIIAEPNKETELNLTKRRNKAVGIAVFCVAAGLALLRVGLFFISPLLNRLELSELANEYALDIIFSLLSQVVVCFLIPLLIYKFYQKRTLKQIFSDANYKKTPLWIILLCLPLGIAFYFFTIYVVNFWLSVLIDMGYTYIPSTTLYPETFSPLLFLLSLTLTAVLPAFCEEFIMRGNFLTSLRQNFRSFGAIVLAAIAFGLFHQNIIQVFYTAIFGAFAAFLVIKTGSVLPAIMMHFVNNGISVYMGHDSYYGWGVGKALDKVLAFPLGALLLLVIGLGVIVLITVIILNHFKDKGIKQLPKLYKPSVRENAWHIGAIVLTASATLFTFLFGLTI